MSRQPQRVLIIGTGSIGERHLRCFLSTERCSVGFVEPHTELAERIGSQYPQTRGFSSLDAALEEAWDSAVIATPAPLHVSLAVNLLERGIHVFIEKPLSTQIDGVDQLTATAKKSRCVVAVAYVYRAHPVLTEMRSALESGRFGRPVQLVATCGQHFPTYRPMYDRIYYANRALGGGAVQDALTHIVNLGEWLIGPIDRVVSDLGHQVLPRVEVEDTVHVLARHGLTMANYSLNQHQSPNEITITVACERGTVRYEHHLNRWRFMEQPDGAWTDSTPIVMERDDWFIRQANSFLDAVEGKAEPLCSLDEGIATLNVNLAILESAQRQAWCSLVAERNNNG